MSTYNIYFHGEERRKNIYLLLARAAAYTSETEPYKVEYLRIKE